MKDYPMSRYISPLRDKMNFHLVTAQYHDLIKLGREVLVASRNQEDRSTEALALVALATAHRRVGKFYEARIFVDGAIDRATEVNHTEILVDALVEYGNIRLEGFFQGYEALDIFEEALAYARDKHYQGGIQGALLGQAHAYLLLNQPATARRYAEEGYQMAQNLLNTVMQVAFLITLSRIYRLTDALHLVQTTLDHAQGISEKLNYGGYLPLIQIENGLLINKKDSSPVFFINEAMRNARLSQDFTVQIEAYRVLVMVYATDSEPDLDVALSYAEEMLGLSQTVNSKPHEASAFSVLGYLQHRQGNIAQALSHYHQAIDLTREMMNPYQEALCLEATSVVYESQRQYDEAIRYREQARLIYRALEDSAKARTLQAEVLMLYVARFVHQVLTLLGVR